MRHGRRWGITAGCAWPSASARLALSAGGFALLLDVHAYGEDECNPPFSIFPTIPILSTIPMKKLVELYGPEQAVSSASDNFVIRRREPFRSPKKFWPSALDAPFSLSYSPPGF
jgi:hypothetical protein